MNKLNRLKRILIGDPLTCESGYQGGEPTEAYPKWKALALLASDSVSSVAYATEEMLLVFIGLGAIGSVSLLWSIPIAIWIAVLLLVLTLSYRKVIRLYPKGGGHGGGAYAIVRENLGPKAGLLAASGLLAEYVLIVVVSVCAAFAAMQSAFPALGEHRLVISSFLIILLGYWSLRGSKSGWVSVIPFYGFVFCLIGLLISGFAEIYTGHVEPVQVPPEAFLSPVPLLILIRAFASGCVALTGFEAVASRTHFFKSPSVSNAKQTLTITSILVGSFFLGITFLARYHGVYPDPDQTLLSSLARTIVNQKPLFYGVQLFTMLILLQAGLGAFRQFPVLTASLARDRYLPRQFASLGDKLVFSNAIGVLVFLTICVTIAVDARVHQAIPLYAVGVFLTFFLVLLSILRKEDTKANWRNQTIVAMGAAVMGFVLVVILAGKFAQGAWELLVLVPGLSYLLWKVRLHYRAVEEALSPVGITAPFEIKKFHHIVLIPVNGVHRGVLECLEYASALSTDVRVCTVEIDPRKTEKLAQDWKRWAPKVPFVVLKSPYRSVIGPFLDYLADLEHSSPNARITVLVPEAVTSRWIHALLHNHTALLIRTALLFSRNKVVSSFRYHLN